ncbi:hypothetical protein A2U01_0034451, partial [Trifolium medium]|nr:hypothetical protein [Trifolium medium]
ATPGNLFKKRGVSTQATINSIFIKDMREACLEIVSFFYNNAIAFHVAKSDEFQRMLEMVARHGRGFKPPSYHEIRTKYLKQKMEETTKAIEEQKLVWKKTGCTIMSDGWTDKRRTILNFLVNSPKDRDHNAANYRAVGAMLMDKRKKLYWTPYAAHCIDLMLEDFEKKTIVHRETISK